VAPPENVDGEIQSRLGFIVNRSMQFLAASSQRSGSYLNAIPCASVDDLLATKVTNIHIIITYRLSNR